MYKLNERFKKDMSYKHMDGIQILMTDPQGTNDFWYTSPYNIHIILVKTINYILYVVYNILCISVRCIDSTLNILLTQYTFWRKAKSLTLLD